MTKDNSTGKDKEFQDKALAKSMEVI